MNYGTIKLMELIQINEAAKALKQKRFMIILNASAVIFGIDNINSCIKSIKLDTDKFYNTLLKNTIINSRDLSNFIKSVLVQSEFEIKKKNNNSLYIISDSGVELEFIYDKYIEQAYNNIICSVINYCNNTNLTEIEENVTNELIDLFSIHKDDGCIYYKYKNRYYITLFYGLLPLNKSDKIFLSIYYNKFNKSFITNFKVVKKKFIVNIFINYLDIKRE